MKRPKMERATTIAGILKAFKPEPLREADLPEFFHANTMAIRMGNKNASPLRGLFDACTTPTNNNAHLFLGHRGCGKSTELTDLKRKLVKAGHPVCTFDTNIETDPFQIDCWSLMLLITEGLFEIAEDANIKIPPEIVVAMGDILLREIINEESYDHAADAKAKVGVEAKTPLPLDGILKLFVSLKGSLKFSERKRTVVKEKMERRASDWLGYIREISAHISAGFEESQPIIIFEGLDKLPFPEKIIDILSFSALAQMPFPVIYTFPIDQFYSTKFTSIKALYSRHVLPMIKVRNIDESPNPEGIKIIREIVGLRADLELFDGNEETGVLNTLIVKTGGSLRHLFECIISAARLANWREVAKVEAQDAEWALTELKMDLSRMVTTETTARLHKIRESIKAKKEIENKDFLLEMVHASVLLEYVNGERWHDVHPLVVDFIADLDKTHE